MVDLLSRLAAALTSIALRTRALAKSYRGKLVPAHGGRPGLMALAYPLPGFRVYLAMHLGRRFFETVKQALDEDLFRVTSLMNAPLNRAERRRALSLARRLLKAIEDGDPVPSLASSVFLRELRIRVTGAIWQLHDELGHLPRSVFTLIPRGLSLTDDELARFDIVRAFVRLRGDLLRAGADKASGCLILFLDGEWDPATERWQLHFDGWAAGDMVAVVRGLGMLRRYDSSDKARAGDTDGVSQRVRVGAKPITNPAYRLSYSLHGFWVSRRSGPWADLGKSKAGRWRQRRKHRVPEPQHARYLLWLDQWTIDEISLRIGLSVKGGRLLLNRRDDSPTNGIG